MAVNKIDGLINGLGLVQNAYPDTEIKLSGYMVRLPLLTSESFNPQQTASLKEWGWVPSPMDSQEGPVPGFEGYIFAGDI